MPRWFPGFGRQSRPRQGSDPDAAVLHELEKAGADLARPTEIAHYLYVPSEQIAHDGEIELVAAGYRCEVRRAARGPGWLVLAKIDLVPSRDVIAQARGRFEDLATRLGGEYDGWEAAVSR